MVISTFWEAGITSMQPTCFGVTMPVLSETGSSWNKIT